MQHGNVTEAKEDITVYAVLVGEASYFISQMTQAETKDDDDFSPFEMSNPTQKAGPKTQLLFDLQNRTPNLEIPVFTDEKQAFYHARKVYPAHAFTICELHIPINQYQPGVSTFNQKSISTVRPDVLSYVTLVTGYTGKDREYHLGKSFTVQKNAHNTIEFTPEDHKIIHVKPK